MVRAKSRGTKRVWRKVVVALMVGVVAIGSLIYWKRCQIAVWYMGRNKTAQETTILWMLEGARPVIEKYVKMTLPQKIFKTMTGKRNQKERQTDALKDVRRFCESGFENHWLKFKDVHHLSSLNGFDFHGFNFALIWNRGPREEALSAFNVNFLKREMSDMKTNENCSFFTELKLYVEKKAKEN
jgi:hypothetical protein